MAGKHWVLLAAGSTGWDNYRHQADVCHAYQIAHQNGIPDEQIVVMMYDDIAYNSENPTAGEIINVPEGTNVYSGVPKDYTEDEVTAETFRAVLKGDTSIARKKVIQCKDGDNIFIYISDHGASGVFCFPNTTLHAFDFIQDLEEIGQRNPSSAIVVFMESCHSGSMLMGLPSNVKVYGVTASSPTESSYACFYDEQRSTYLADEFSVAWMHYTETKEGTLTDVYKSVLETVKGSTPEQYGNTDEIGILPISAFLKEGQQKKKNALKITHITKSHEVPLQILRKKIEAASNASEKNKLTEKLHTLEKTHKEIDKVAEKIKSFSETSGGGKNVNVQLLQLRQLKRTHLQDLKTVNEHFRSTFFDWHDEQFVYSLSKLSIFVNLLTSGLDAKQITRIITEIKASG